MLIILRHWALFGLLFFILAFIQSALQQIAGSYRFASPCLLEKALLCFWLGLHCLSAISPLLGGGSLQCIMHYVI